MISQEDIIKTSAILKNDGVIGFPTDTVWGLGCVVESKQAVDKIYKIKSRESQKPLILLSNKLKYLLPYVDKLPQKAKELAEKYFPGALTIVVQKSSKTPDYMTSGFNTVGIRVPAHPVFCEIAENIEGHVLATTSANLSGEGAFSKKEDVEKSIGKDVDYIFEDYGYSAGGQESTVVYVDENNKIKILRQGVVILEG